MKLDDQFVRYHKDNPNVFRLFREFSMIAMSKGYSRFGAKAIFERVRWEININTKERSGLKLNNNYTSRYARLLAEKHPKFLSFFFFRKLHDDKVIAQPVSGSEHILPDNHHRFPWRDLNVGDHFLVKGKTLSDMSAAKAMAAKRTGFKLQSEQEESGVRVRRIG